VRNALSALQVAGSLSDRSGGVEHDGGGRIQLPRQYVLQNTTLLKNRIDTSRINALGFAKTLFVSKDFSE
jgi:hypothetical protein